jgi:hypothetical protein
MQASGTAGRRVVAGLLAALPMPMLAACGSDRMTSPPPRSQAPDRATVEVPRTVPRAVQHAFAPFRSSPEPLPRTVTALLREPTGGADWRLAQQLRGTGDLTVWAVAGRRAMCLISQARGSAAVTETCTSTRRAIAHGVFFTSLAETSAAPATTRLVVGLVPDRTHRVRIHTTGAAAMTATVASNTFALRDRVADPADRISPLP